MLPYILEELQKRRERVIDLQRALTAIPAMGPENGGDGELRKIHRIEEELIRRGITDLQRINAPDDRVPDGIRPNLVARVPGKTSRTLWILGHTDVVPPGEPALWTSDPWTLTVDGDTMIGRGVEDNQQALVSGLLLAEELVAARETPDLSLGLLCMADEETGNRYGLEYVLRVRPDLFRPDDVILVPDFGAPDGALVEVAEKAVLWLKVSVIGRQCHGSTPHKGVNAMVAGADLTLRLLDLHREFPAEDALFEPPVSTFTPTRHDANVPNVNTVPGTDVFYMDCRLLPCYTPDDVLAAARRIAREVEEHRGVQVDISPDHLLPTAPPTPVDSEVVVRLTEAIRNVYGVAARPVGVGGSTVACLLRQRGLPAAVWCRVLSNCHEPDERALISNTIGDAQVFAHLLYTA